MSGKATLLSITGFAWASMSGIASRIITCRTIAADETSSEKSEGIQFVLC